MKYIYFIIFLFSHSLLGFGQIIRDFETGSSVLINENLELLSGQKVALITNATGVDKNKIHIIENLFAKGVNIVKIFTPEHGFFANDKYNIPDKKIPVISLYGENYSINKYDAEDVDIFLFDIQDLGARFYTYTSTLYLTMLDAVKFGKKYIVCDRPPVSNPEYIGGFMLEPEFESFVSKIYVPMIYGLTIGELANYLNKFYVKNDNFSVINMKGFKRGYLYENLLNFWINPSPSITSLQSARIYPALCLLEGTNISEGRGTLTPFQVFGAPFLDTSKLLTDLNAFNLPGLKFTSTAFIPDQSLLPSYSSMKYVNEVCYGIKIEITDLKAFLPFETSVAILLSIKNNSVHFKWIKKNFIDKLSGTDALRKMIDKGSSFEEIIDYQKKTIEDFRAKMSDCKLYD